MRLSPCKGCTKRTTGHNTVSCHATCERYINFRRALDSDNKLAHAEGDINGYVVINHVKIQRAK